MKDYYTILGISFGANSNDIKKAYRQLALKYHPDKNKEPDAAEKFIAIHEAYEILYNEQKRAYYDSIFIRHKTTGYNENNEFKNWTEEAQNHGQEYSQMPYDFFIVKVFNTLHKAHQTTGSWFIMLGGLAMFFICIFLICLSLYKIVIGIDKFEYSIIISWILLTAFAILGSRAFIILKRVLL